MPHSTGTTSNSRRRTSRVRTGMVHRCLSRLDDLLYDSTYRLRRAEDRSNGPVVILAVDDKSLDEIKQGLIRGKHLGWPWPREYWGLAVKYLNECGAKAIVFDLLFTEPS